MPYALIGVLRDVEADSTQALECIREDFTTWDDAYSFAKEYFSKTEVRRRFVEVYPQPYDGDHWIPRGGRCHLYAHRVFTEEYQKIVDRLGGTPVLVHGYCIALRDGQEQVSGHAWIEAGETVMDCGSYKLCRKYHDKADYYRVRSVSEHEYQRYSLAEAIQCYERYGVPFPWQQPPAGHAAEMEAWRRLLAAP